MEDAYEMAESVANDAYLFVTPVYLSAIAEAGHDPDNIRAQLEFAQRACVEIAGPRCILTDAMWEERSYYSNITHLNGTGGAYLGRLVTGAIR